MIISSKRNYAYLFLALQIILIIYARFIPERFFCWAPYDEHSYYEIKVEVEGRTLTNQEVYQRYRYKAKGWESRCIENVISIVKQYEESNAINEEANVEIVYQINGHKEKKWIQ